MIATLDFLRDFNLISITVRLILAMFFGGLLGLERGSKHRPAGFRTYMLVCIGATLTMIMGQYEHYMLANEWRETALLIGASVDVSRFGAQVINGIGFIGVGTVLVTSKREIKGLTTAACLWASACMGLAIGAGFYECVFFAFFLMFVSMTILPKIENYIIEYAGYMSLCIEFQSLEHLGKIIAKIKNHDVKICDMEIHRGRETGSAFPNVIFTIRLNKRSARTQLMVSLSELQEIYLLKEI